MKNFTVKQTIMLMGDSYKYSHHLQLPKNSAYMTSYIEARGSKDPYYRNTVFFGIGMFIKAYLLTPITKADVDDAKIIVESHGEPFNYKGWMKIVNKCNGKLPIEIQSVKEGTVIGLSNALVQIRNTRKGFAWLVSFIETSILRGIWYPTTIATLSRNIKQDIIKYSQMSGADVNDMSFKLNDFGSRGVSSNESAGIGGIAHLVNFMGTDNITAILYGRTFYNINMAGFSIPAMEHSTVTSWGKDGEKKAYENMIRVFSKDGSMFAIVVDSYDDINAVKRILGNELKELIKNSGGKLIIRPDSGNAKIKPIKIIQIAMEAFGYTINEKGYRQLPSYIGVIQGDGINKDSIQDILTNMELTKLSMDNLAFGMGGQLLQGVDRDTLQFAMKANFIEFSDGTSREVYKDPVTDIGKRSKRGVQGVYLNEDGTYVTTKVDTNRENQLNVVYRDGEVIREQTFDEIRELAK